jgi:hypothetical protein
VNSSVSNFYEPHNKPGVNSSVSNFYVLIAADKNTISIAIGIGSGYVDEELSNITNGIKDNIFKTDFSELATIAAKATVEKLCLCKYMETDNEDID